MHNEQFTPEEITQTLRSFEAGVNSGISPLLLERNQLAGAGNTTVRNNFVHPRPPVKKINFNAAATAMIADAFKDGKYQGGGYFRPDNGSGSILAQIGGHVLQFTPGTTGSATVADRNPTLRNPATQAQAWIWQSEKWAIVQDGLSNPLFIDGPSCVRSNYNAPLNFSTTTTAPFGIPGVGLAVSPAVGFTDVTNLATGDIFTVPNRGTFQVTNVTPTIAPAGDVDFINLTATPSGFVVAYPATVSWTHIGTQLPPGRMGTYGLGRNWFSLIDGRQFVGTDQVGGASGTQANQYRDAVLNITENLFLLGGGNFTVPGSPGDIRAMKFTATLNVSLGQGPLQVFTPNSVFSCQAPVDRTIWQTVTNPILTESVITNGGLSQEATVNVNNDILTRAIDGIRSMKVSQQDFNLSWPTVPISFEVSPQLSRDNQTLLGYTSAIVFDNRYLLTTAPKATEAGIYWQDLIPLNLDPLSTLRGKEPPIYDSLTWSGLNVFQLCVGQFGGVERAFALTWNEVGDNLELYELLKSADSEYQDDGTRRIVWHFESASLFKDRRDERRKYKRLLDGEIQVQNMVGTVDFAVYWKPDQWPCWVPWHAWTECVGSSTPSKPGFRPRMGLGEPPAPRPDPANPGRMLFCDESNDRPLREGYTFQFMVVVTGYCEVVEMNLKAVAIPEPEFARPTCCPDNDLILSLARKPFQTQQDVFAILDANGRAIGDVNDDAILQT